MTVEAGSAPTAGIAAGDRRAAPGARFLDHLNPLAAFAGPAPAMIALVAVRDLWTPAAFLLLAYAVILAGARLSGRTLLILVLAVPGSIALLGVGFAVWTDASRIPHDDIVLSIGPWTLYGAALEIGFATALRLGAILTLALIGGLTTTGADLTRSLTQQLRVPYRIAYTALAAIRFVPRFAHELEVIRAAHRVRGAARGRGPLTALRRRAGYVVPLLAGAIRHAERVALSMDARAFGAYPQRTERYLIPFRARDVVFIGLFWAATVTLFLVLRPWG